MGKQTEKGLIYFFYRPKVGNEEVSSASDVQKLYILLAPKIGAVAQYPCCQYAFENSPTYFVREAIAHDLN